MKHLRHYDVPEKIINIIQISHDGLHFKVVRGGELTDALQVNISVRQDCLPSSFLFLLSVDWITKNIPQRKHGIQ